MIKKFIITLAFTFIVPLSADDKEKMIEYLRTYKGQHTFLLSYPRSGNTWLRYCLEYLTHCPSFMRSALDKTRDQPLAWSCGFEIDMTKPPIEKVHIRKELNNGNTHPKNKLILIVRNPKEAISRNEHNLITLEMLQGKEGVSLYNRGTSYFDNIALYDSWVTDKRILVYYEDLLTNPCKELTRILNFLQEPLTGLDAFMKEYATHKKKCLAIYKEGESQGEDLLFHSKKTDPAYRALIDEWIEELYPGWWNKYLKDYYAEEILDYGNSLAVN